MAENTIKSSELIDGPGILNDLSRINVELKEMVNSLDVQLRKAIPVLNSLKINNSQSIKDMNQAMKESNAILQQQIKLQSLQAKTEKEIDSAKIRSLKIQQEEQKAIKETSKAKAQLNAEAEREKKAREKANKEIEKTSDLYGKESKRLNDLRKEYKNLVLSEGEATDRARKLGQEIGHLDAKLKAVDKSVGQFQRNVGNYPKSNFLTTTLGVLGGNLLFRGVQAISAGIKHTIELNKEFEKSIQNLSAITGATGKDLEFYSKQARLMGQTTKGGAVAVVEAFKLIGSAKPELLANKEALVDVTKQAVLLSKAAGLDLPDAATRLTDALNQFGAPAKDAGKFVDILAAGAKAGAAEVPQITDALLKFGVAAKSSNITIQESVAAIELLAEKGEKGAEAGTKLRNVFGKLDIAKALPKEAINELRKAGVNLETLSNKSLPLASRLKELAKIQGNSAAITKTFGEENKLAGMILIENIPRLEELTKLVDENGVALTQATTNTDTYEQAVSDLSGAWDSFILNLTEGNSTLKNVFSEAAKALRGLNAELENNADIQKKIGDTLPGITKGLVGLLHLNASNAQTTKQVRDFNQVINAQSEEINNLTGKYVEQVKSKKENANLSEAEIKKQAKLIMLSEAKEKLDRANSAAQGTRVKLFGEQAASLVSLTKGGKQSVLSSDAYIANAKIIMYESDLLNKGLIVEEKKKTAEEIKIENEKNEEIKKLKDKESKEAAAAYEKRLKDEQDFRNKIRQLQISAIADEKLRNTEQAYFDYEKELQGVARSTANEKVKNEVIYNLGIELRNKLNKLDEDADQKANEKRIEEIKKKNQAEENIRQENFAFEIEQQQANFEKQKQLKAESDKQISEQELKDLEKFLDETLELRKNALRDRYLFERTNGNLNKDQLLELENKYNNDVLRLEKESIKTKEELEKESRESILAADKEALEKRKQVLFEYLNKALDLAQQEIQKTAQLKQEGLDKEIAATQRNISVQQALAERGKANTLAFEEAELAKEQLRKEQLKKKEIKDQKALAFLKLLAGYAEKEPGTALQKALIDTALASAISGAFYEGTEKVSNDLDGNPNKKDGYIVRVDGSERVMTGEQNKLIGNMSNEDLATLAHNYNNGIYLPDYAMNLNSDAGTAKNIYDSAQLNQMILLNKKIERLEHAINNKPVGGSDLTPLGDVVNWKIRNALKEVNIIKNPRLRW